MKLGRLYNLILIAMAIGTTGVFWLVGFWWGVLALLVSLSFVFAVEYFGSKLNQFMDEKFIPR